MLFFGEGLAASSQRTYKAQENRYLRFCKLCEIRLLPVSELLLSKFVAYLAENKLKIKTYLSGVCFLHLKGTKWVEAREGGAQRLCTKILRAMKRVWSVATAQPDTKMIWAACCLAFFAFLRAGEMTVPDDGSYDLSVHLSLGNIAVDHTSCPTFVRITI